MAKKRQKTIWVSRDRERAINYWFWPHKPHYRQPFGYGTDTDDSCGLCVESVDKLLPHLNLKKRGLKKLTIIVEDVE